MSYDNQHRKALNNYIQQVEKVYQKLISQTSTIAVKTKLEKELFEFKKHPKITKRIQKILSDYEIFLLFKYTHLILFAKHTMFR